MFGSGWKYCTTRATISCKLVSAIRLTGLSASISRLRVARGRGGAGSGVSVSGTGGNGVSPARFGSSSIKLHGEELADGRKVTVQ